jgi:hypothetical protein
LVFFGRLLLKQVSFAWRALVSACGQCDWPVAAGDHGAVDRSPLAGRTITISPARSTWHT